MRRNYWLIYRDDGFDDGVGTIVSEEIATFEEAQIELTKWNDKQDGFGYFDIQHQSDDD